MIDPNIYIGGSCIPKPVAKLSDDTDTVEVLTSQLCIGVKAKTFRFSLRFAAKAEFDNEPLHTWAVVMQGPDTKWNGSWTSSHCVGIWSGPGNTAESWQHANDNMVAQKDPGEQHRQNSGSSYIYWQDARNLLIVLSRD